MQKSMLYKRLYKRCCVRYTEGIVVKGIVDTTIDLYVICNGTVMGNIGTRRGKHEDK